VPSNLQLDGKAIVVVGGTGGLGLSATKACIREGANVVAVGRDPAKALVLEKELGPKARIISGDATKPETADLAIRKCVEEFGALHGLYHVAGGSGRRLGDGPLHEITDQGWNYTLELNLTSIFNSNRAATRWFVENNKHGSIVNCGSVLGWSPSPKFFTTHAYAAAKGALIGLTKASASFYASKNVRFNVLAPGLVATPMSARAQSDEAILKFIATKQPLDGGRIGAVEDLDSALVWLLSDSSRFVTGQVIAIDGGWTVSEGQVSPA
jgi:NAD(P)-dependent dehydrogenase (short-subunit alcohol dehydrogenase family)